jgi:hypothetical protein
MYFLKVVLKVIIYFRGKQIFATNFYIFYSMSKTFGTGEAHKHFSSEFEFLVNLHCEIRSLNEFLPVAPTFIFPFG